MELVLKTPKQNEREKKQLKLYKDFVELSKNPKNKRMAIISHLLQKYGYKSQKTIYEIIKKGEQGII